MISQLAEVLSRKRLPFSTEQELQIAIERELAAAGISFEREARISRCDRPDFLIDGAWVIEVKVGRWSRIRVYRQVERYLAHERIKGCLFVSPGGYAFPPEIHGKPVHVLSLGVAWL